MNSTYVLPKSFSGTSSLSKKYNTKSPLKTDKAAFKEFCTIIDSLQCKEIKKRIYTAMDTILFNWERQHESLLTILNEYENAYEKLQNDYQIQKMKYDSTLQEMQFYKLKYETSVIINSDTCNPNDHSNNSNNNSENHNNSQQNAYIKNDRYSFQSLNSSRNSTITSNSSIFSSGRISKSSYYSSPFDYEHHPNNSIIRPTSPLSNQSLGSPFLYHHQRNNSGRNDGQLDILSVLEYYPSLESIPSPKSPPPDDLPLPPLPPSSSSSSSPSIIKDINQITSSINSSSGKNNMDDDTNFSNYTIPLSSTDSQINLPPRSLLTTEKISTNNEELEYGCGEGFWHTIARGKLDKEGVDSLVANYIKRGGKTNVANHTATIKSVKEGYGLIHALIAIKNTSALKRIISAGVNTYSLPLGKCEQDKISPLVLAAKLNYMNGVRLLIERAFTNVLESKGPNQESALHAAAESDALEIAIYLLRICPHGLIDQVDINGATPLHYACKSGKIRMITYLVNTCGISPNKANNLGETSLHYAIRNRRGKAVVKLVSELGAYPNAYIIKQVPTPLDLAKSGGLRTIADYLRKMGGKTVKEMEKTIHHQQKESNIVQPANIICSSNCSTHSGKTSTSEGSSSSVSSKSYVLGATSLMKSKLDELMSKS